MVSPSALCEHAGNCIDVARHAVRSGDRETAWAAVRVALSYLVEAIEAVRQQEVAA